jgi:flavorubredoxin
VIHDSYFPPGAPAAAHMNAMLIRGAEPVVVDTGTPLNRAGYLDDLFSLVDPSDVRWVFISHDDVDHYGNLHEVMARARTPRSSRTGSSATGSPSTGSTSPRSGGAG